MENTRTAKIECTLTCVGVKCSQQICIEGNGEDLLIMLASIVNDLADKGGIPLPMFMDMLSVVASTRHDSDCVKIDMSGIQQMGGGEG